MATRQYIGARYVPIFFDDGNGGNEWTSGVAYEPLTIVTYLTNSYTSKKLVPAGIGNPANNPEYWVPTGIYNAQVQEYRREVEEYKQGYLNGKYVAILGDSNMERFSRYDHWSEFTNATIENVSQSGAKWANMLTQLTSLTHVPDIMLICCGSNDITASDRAHLGEVLGAPDIRITSYSSNGKVFDTMKQFLTAARQTYPKCEIICITRADHPTIESTMWQYYTYFEKCIMNAFSVPVIDAKMLLNVAEFITQQSAWAKDDRVHFSDEAQERFTDHLTAILKNAWLYNITLDKPTCYFADAPQQGASLENWINVAAWTAFHCYDRSGVNQTLFAYPVQIFYRNATSDSGVYTRALPMAGGASSSNMNVRMLVFGSNTDLHFAVVTTTDGGATWTIAKKSTVNLTDI